MKQVTAITLAEFILASYPEKNISPMKLQKLVYYAKAWTLVAGTPCTDDQFERWEYGPVNREIYFAYKQHAKNNIPTPESMTAHIRDEDVGLLRFILDSYVDYSAVALSAMTHRESPWIETAPDQLITDQAIYDYYSKRSFARNFQEKPWDEGTYYVLKTNSWYSFTMDMTDEEAERYESYPSYAEYLKRSEQSNEDFNKFIKRILS